MMDFKPSLKEEISFGPYNTMNEFTEEDLGLFFDADFDEGSRSGKIITHLNICPQR